MRRRPSSARLSAGALVNHWVYRVALREVQRTMRRPEYKVPGPGMTKKEIAKLLVAYQETHLKPDRWLTRATINGYLQSAVALGLMDASGNGARRTYYPPGYLRQDSARAMERKAAQIEALAATRKRTEEA